MSFYNIVCKQAEEVIVLKKSIGRLISILHRQSQIYFNHCLKEYDVTSAEYSFLMALYRKDGVTQDELSSYLYIDKSATARAIKSLEDKGYIMRSKDHLDKRFNRVFLTEKAKACKDEIREKVWSWSNFLREGINEQDIDTVVSVLETMVKKVEKTNLKETLEES